MKINYTVRNYTFKLGSNDVRIIFDKGSVFPRLDSFYLDSKTSCGIRCSQRSQKICASDKKTYNTMCEFEEAKCSDGSLRIVHYGECSKWNLAFFVSNGLKSKTHMNSLFHPKSFKSRLA